MHIVRARIQGGSLVLTVPRVYARELGLHDAGYCTVQIDRTTPAILIRTLEAWLNEQRHHHPPHPDGPHPPPRDPKPPHP